MRQASPALAFLLMQTMATVASAADTALIADIRGARSTVAEAAEVQGLAATGRVTSVFARVNQSQVRDDLTALAEKYRNRAPQFAQELDKALRALEAGDGRSLLGVAGDLGKLQSDAAAD